MGKNGFLTPKAIANRIKAKGLQKLRWYCQMCEKQCRDENGFKCHISSESHQRQLLLFADNPEKYVDTYSQDFIDGFVDLLSRRFGTKRVQANIVYQEYISDREHIRMNSTQWETLTDFVKYLGREGKCVADQTEKGWFIQYIDRDPEAIKRMEATEAKDKMVLDDEERSAKFIQKQIERASQQIKGSAEAEFTELQRDDEDEKVTFSLSSAAKKTEEAATAKSQLSHNPFKKIASAESAGISKKNPGMKPGIAGQKRKSALEDIMKMEETQKEKQNRRDYWLHEGIVVKVVFKKLGEKYYKKKGFIKEVRDLYTGIIKMLESGDTLKVDQMHVETVIPAQGRPVMIVNGAYRGHKAVLENINEEEFSCNVILSSGPLTGRVIKVRYEDLSKLHQPS